MCLLYIYICIYIRCISILLVSQSLFSPCSSLSLFIYRYAFHACVIIEFSGTKTPCDGSGVIADCDGNNYGRVNGEDIADFYAVQGSLGFNYAMQIVLFVIVRLFAYVALRVHKPANRN